MISTVDPEPRRRAQSLDVQAWTVRRLVDAITGTGNERIFIPSFQRSFVWKKDRQTNLIQSICDCNPVGSLLFYNAGIMNGKQQYEIVDGLQRSTSLVRYERAVFESFRAADIDEEWLDGLLEKLDDESETVAERRLLEKRTRNSIAKWFQDCTSFDADGGYRIAGLIDAIERASGSSNILAKAGLLDHVQNYLEAMRSRLDIGSYKIPVVVFSGERSVLPEIFENLNTKGVKLNKFDILASSWNDASFETELPVLTKKIRERIEALSKGDVERNPDSLGANRYYLYDAVCALGNLLCEEYPDLFRKKTKAAEEPASCGFNTVALCFELGLSEIDKVPLRLEEAGSPDEYVIALLSAADETSRMLAPTVGGSFEGRASRTTDHAHQELQMAAIVASTYRAKMGLGPGAYVSSSDRMRFARQQYLSDALRSEWSGTGDTKAITVVRNDRYGQPVSRTNFMSNAHSWYLNHLEDARFRSSRKGGWIMTDTLAFLRAYLFSSGVPLQSIGGSIRAEVAIPQVAILMGNGSPLVVSNVRLTDASGHVLADPGSAVPALPSAPSADELRHHLEQRFRAMLDKIVLAYEFVD